MAIIPRPQTTTKEGTRASVTFPADLYSELERIAGDKKVSVAWVVRDAVEKYVEAQYPLFASPVRRDLRSDVSDDQNRLRPARAQGDRS